MAKKTKGKTQFDWSRYERPARLLTHEQEESLADGLLAPVLHAALASRESRFAIRARSANVYHRGANLLRLRGDGPFIFEFESPDGVTAVEVGDAEAVTRAVERLEAERASVEAQAVSADRPGDRAVEQSVAAANAGSDLYEDELIVLDMAYTYGKRRWGLLALQRREGVTGPGGFANPLLTFVDVRTSTRGLAGESGLEPVGADFTDLVKALGGTHLDRIRLECEEMIEQQQRLGLLTTELDVRGFTEEPPVLLTLFVDTDVSDATYDAAFQALHDRVIARHVPSSVLRFASIETGGAGDRPLTLCAGDIMPYRPFRESRKRSR